MRSEEEQDIKTYFVKVILPLPLDTFTYRIQRVLNNQIAVGQLVAVKFGRKKKKIYGGIVSEISEQGPSGYQASYIQEIVDETPLISAEQLKFWKWLSSYYLCKLGDVMVAALPAGMRLSGETRLFVNSNETLDPNLLSSEELKILSLLEKEAYITPEQLEKEAQIQNPLKFIRSLYERNLLLVAEEMNLKSKSKTRSIVKLNFQPSNEKALKEAFEQVKRSPKQTELLLEIINEGGTQERKILLQKTQSSYAILHGLIKKGLVGIHQEEISRFQISKEDHLTFELSKEQDTAVKNIEIGFANKKPTLLMGPTASGKTYVYLDLIQKTLAEGKQVLYLLPEIALTEQIISKLKNFLGNDVLVTHSKYNLQERAEIWELLRSKAVNVIVGPRSSIFSPFFDLGLIIVDEEHESSFKQNEKAPRFHGRDSALVLAQIWNANILLGSATPSIESMYFAQKDKYHMVNLEGKFAKMGSITYQPIHLKDAIEKNKMNEMFSFEMIEQIKETVSDGRQVIVFHNRKGFVPETQCLSCGWIPQCPNCDISLTYYKYNQVMRCHYCGFKSSPPVSCNNCGSHQLQLEGYGTEKITEILQAILSETKIERFDQESTRKKKAHREIMERFKSGETQILVGTQLLAKGFDFENVDLVAVINADHMLYFPDFRSGERTYQLITQVSGRTGRHDNDGKVLIQSYQPSHPVLQSIINEDYPSMFDSELREREEFLYPPFTRLVLIQIKDFEALNAEKLAHVLGNELRSQLGSRVIGPSKPPISKINRWYIREILVKINRSQDQLHGIKQAIQTICLKVNQLPEHRKSRIVINVDPN